MANANIKGKFFTKTVEPDMGATFMHQNAYTASDILFDWTEFKLPRGGSKLMGITALMRTANGTLADVIADLVFAKSTGGTTAPTSLGTRHDQATGTGFQNNIIGQAQLVATDFVHGIDNLSIATYSLPTGYNGIVFDDGTEGNNDSGGNSFWVAGIAISTPNFASTVTIAEDGFAANTQTAITVGTTDANLVIAPGDTVAGSSGNVMGKVKTVTDTLITLEKANEEAIAGTDTTAEKVYNISPIKLVLSFER